MSYFFGLVFMVWGVFAYPGSHARGYDLYAVAGLMFLVSIAESVREIARRGRAKTRR